MFWGGSILVTEVRKGIQRKRERDRERHTHIDRETKRRREADGLASGLTKKQIRGGEKITIIERKNIAIRDKEISVKEKKARMKDR